MEYIFTKHRTCQTKPMPFFDKKAYFLDKGNAVDSIVLSCSKTFNMVPHGISLVNLEKM